MPIYRTLVSYPPAGVHAARLRANALTAHLSVLALEDDQSTAAAVPTAFWGFFPVLVER